MLSDAIHELLDTEPYPPPDMGRRPPTQEAVKAFLLELATLTDRYETDLLIACGMLAVATLDDDVVWASVAAAELLATQVRLDGNVPFEARHVVLPGRRV